jgi:hypothetical protein
VLLPEVAPRVGVLPGALFGSPGMLYSAFHAEPDGSVDSVAGETP